MGAEFAASPDYLDYLIAQLFGVERADSNTVDRRSLGNHFQQPGQIDRRRQVFAVAAKMHARERDLFEASLRQPVERGNYAARLDATRGSARNRNDTEAAKLIASFLQLQERARLSGQRDGADLDFSALLAQIRDHDALGRRGGNRAFEVI